MRLRSLAASLVVGGAIIGGCAKFSGTEDPPDSAFVDGGADATPTDAAVVDAVAPPRAVHAGEGVACGTATCKPPMICCSGAIGEQPRCIARTESCDGGVTRDCDDGADCPAAIGICCMSSSTGGEGSFCAAGCDQRYQMCSTDNECMVGKCHVVACSKVAASLCSADADAGCPSP